MNELELQNGKITFKALADWFDIAYSTIRNNKEKYLNARSSLMLHRKSLMRL